MASFGQKVTADGPKNIFQIVEKKQGEKAKEVVRVVGVTKDDFEKDLESKLVDINLFQLREDDFVVGHRWSNKEEDLVKAKYDNDLLGLLLSKIGMIDVTIA